MKITCISDTHGSHRQVKLSGGDLLIFAGDWQAHHDYQADDFALWLSEQNYKIKIVVRGNHDSNYTSLDHECSKYPDIYILHDDYVKYGRHIIYGTPWSVRFGNWSYMANEDVLEKIFSRISEYGTTILISHSPAFGVLDKVGSIPAGSQALTNVINNKLVDLELHVCGHIHEGYGKTGLHRHLSVNASQMDERYRLVNKPVDIFISD